MACSGSTPTLTAASTSYSDVNDCHTAAIDGDTVIVPAGGPTTWTSTLEITKAITLQGNGIGSTKIAHNVTTGSKILFNITAVAGKATRVTGFEISWIAGDPNPNGVISMTGAPGGTIRFDHNKLDHLNTFNIRTSNARGVIDHNTFLFGDTGTFTPFYIYDQGATLNGDLSWGSVATGGTALTWGSSDFLFVEDNTITHDSGDGACSDGNSGSRAVFRFNTVSGCSFQNHGTESFGRSRSGRAMECYGNIYAGTADEILGCRGGTALVWQNVGVASTAAAVKMTNDRGTDRFYSWDMADGTNKWDLNDAGNPFQSKTASSGTALTVTVTGAGWTVNQWAGYVIKKTTTACAPPNRGFNAGYGVAPYYDQCASIILSNTSDTLTYQASAGFARDMSFTGAFAGDTFDINKVTRAMDQPGVGGGTTLVEVANCNVTSVGTTATVSCTHGLTDLDYVSIYYNSDGLGILSPYYGIFQAHVSNPSTFTYTCPTTCGGAITVYLTKIPIPNDQTYDPIYQWLNTDGTSNILTTKNPSTLGVAVENSSFYNYGGTLQSNATTPFNGTAAVNNGVGVGTKARMPTSCTGQSWYWATDEGSWRTAVPTTGQTFQGLGYQCNGSTFALAYTPYTYPYIPAVETQHPAVMIPMRMVL